MHTAKDFPRPDLGPNISPFPTKNRAKTSQNGVYHSKFLSSTFWCKFCENPTKNFHENLHKNVNENMFSFTFLCKIFMIFMKWN